MNWLHLRFGLYMTRADWIKLTVVWSAYWAFVAALSWGLVELTIYVNNHNRLAGQHQKSTKQAKHYEQIVLSCLRHDWVTVNGEFTTCELGSK